MARPKTKPARATAEQVAKLSEDSIQQMVVGVLNARLAPGVSWFAIPNGGYRSKATASRMKQTGTRAGTPDMAFVIAGRPHFLELKRARGGRVSPEQREMIAELENAGAVVAVARGIQAALATLNSWGAINPPRARMALAA